MEEEQFEYPFRDTSLPLDQRVQDLVSRLTTEEKIGLITVRTKAVERLGIERYRNSGEILHGLGLRGVATVFPQAIGLAATFDPGLIRRSASAAADEARAKFHNMREVFGYHNIGLNYWAPNVNIFRDPRWGRGQETFGEDPVLSSIMGVAFIRGLQGDDPRYLKVSSCVKHFAVHSGPEAVRHVIEPKVTKKDLFETYLPAFKAAVDAGVDAVMGAYNKLFGVSCCANKYLFTDILREQWGFEGHVVSDYGGVGDIHYLQDTTLTVEDAASMAIKAGLDIESGPAYAHLAACLAQGRIDESVIDRAASKALRTRFRLGMFDTKEEVPYTSIPMSKVNCTAHRKLAYECAAKSMVLLKNSGILPLGNKAKRIFVTGPNAFENDPLIGNYHGINDRMPTFLESIVRKAGKKRIVQYTKGCAPFQPTINGPDRGGPRVHGADVIIACMGISSEYEGEEYDPILSENTGDRIHLGLPPHQVEFLRKLKKSGKPLVVVITAGSAIIDPEVYELADAVVYAWYPGQEGGPALADILFGNVSPSGRLSITIYASDADLPPFEDYSMKNRTYRYMESSPYYPFGYGLSYTSFSYGAPRLNRSSVAQGESLAVAVEITNTGKRAGDEVVQLYLTDREASVDVPRYALKDFRRVSLGRGESVEVEFTVTPEMMQLIDNDGTPRIEPGEFDLWIGGACPHPRTRELGVPVVGAGFRVE